MEENTCYLWGSIVLVGLSRHEGDEAKERKELDHCRIGILMLVCSFLPPFILTPPSSPAAPQTVCLHCLLCCTLWVGLWKHIFVISCLSSDAASHLPQSKPNTGHLCWTKCSIRSEIFKRRKVKTNEPCSLAVRYHSESCCFVITLSALDKCDLSCKKCVLFL